MINAVIVDDEKRSRDLLNNQISKCSHEIKIVATASSVKSAFEIINESMPDLVFLDIELGDGKGFDLLSLFKKIPFKVIFVTAYSEFAVRAFKVNAIDYILKPVSCNELTVAINKALSTNNTEKGEVYRNIAELVKSNADHTDEPYITVPNLKGFDILKVKDIIMCSADGYCTVFTLISGKQMYSSKNLKYYENLLNDYNFYRVHHSYLINLNHLQSFTKQGEIHLIEGTRAYLGDKYRQKFIRNLLSKQGAGIFKTHL